MKTEPLPPTDRVQCDQILPQQDLHSGRFKHRQVNNTGGQTVLHRQSAAIAQSTTFLRSLAERIIFRPLTHLITYGEFLSTRKQKIEQSKSEPQRRFPFLLNSLMLLSTRFDGADRARLYDFSKGCWHQATRYMSRWGFRRSMVNFWALQARTRHWAGYSGINTTPIWLMQL